MQISYERALEVYDKITDVAKCPSLHPTYVNIDAKREKGLEPSFFVYEEDGYTYYHAFHVARVPETSYFDIQSPYGYGGPICTTENQQFIKRAWNSYLDWCKANNIIAEFIRFHPIIGNWKYYSGEVIFDRETVWINLQSNNIIKEYQTRAQRKVRKAESNGLTVEWCNYEEFFHWFPKLYEDLMKTLNADKFYCFPNEYFEAWENYKEAKFALCKLENKVLAASIFYHDEHIMEYHLSASNTIGKELAATPLLIHEAAKLSKHIGCDIFHLGGGTDNNPNNPLFFFKSGFSSKRGSFRIGKFIHNQSVYEEYKTEWKLKNDTESNRILFYR